MARGGTARRNGGHMARDGFAHQKGEHGRAKRGGNVAKMAAAGKSGKAPQMKAGQSARG